MTPRELILTRKAYRDIDHNLEWLRIEYSARSANRWQNLIGKAFLELLAFPERFSLCEDISHPTVELREKLDSRYRVVYRILYSFDDTVVTIHRVRNASQDSLSEDDL